MFGHWSLVPPVVLLAAAAAVILEAEDYGPHALPNLLPPALTLALLLYALARDGWRWHEADRRWLLGVLGFAIPALGLSLYLHLGLMLDWGGMASRARTPELLFRFLPYYTTGAGAIGFAIGWIIGRNLDGERRAPRRRRRQE
ncbi:hypothetical protein [Lentisalinibacter salinarum]|uniref:hypothetical protein n=1 Tax=Lentisalinibacter salinarum TaxID=2992239 RepID=UPI00386C66F4